MSTLPSKLSFALAALAACLPAQDTLRVGAWNLEHFGARRPPRTEANIQAIADKIREIRADVLGLQEIRTEEALQSLRAKLGGQWQYVIGTSGGFRDGTGAIRLAFLWNGARADLVQAEELLQLPSEDNGLPIFHRKPVSCVFRRKGGGVDFRAITVHFKASRGKQNEAKRCAEARNLKRYLTELLAKPNEDKDVVVLGDFNHTFDAPAYREFTAQGFCEYLRAPGNPRTIVHFPEPIDQVALIGNGLADDLAASRLTVHGEQAAKDLQAWRNTYSDHIPVTVDLVANVDHDKTATFTRTNPKQWLKPGGASAVANAANAAAANANSVRPRPLSRGSKVRVLYLRYAEGGATRDLHGVLAADLGKWVQVTTDDGVTVAIPAERVMLVSSVKD